MLQIFNTLSRKKEEFKPIHKKNIGMYVCGITLYDLCHIGHARTFIIFDVISRYLRHLGYKLTYVRNITDIDDKIIQRATKNNESVNDLTNRMFVEMNKDFSLLNILPPDKEPRVTHYINDIIIFIEKLIKSGHSYVAKNGDVMFDVKTYHSYGILSGQNLNKLKTGKHIKYFNIKNNEMDFVLWKMSKKNEPSWNSPWGKGRPGWHIECSVMNNIILGNHFDIHGGGCDLIFPHHENEIAQSVSIYNCKYVNYWMHSGMVTINEKKMSKSLNKFITIRDILKDYDAEVLRFFLLSSHYRSSLNYSKENLKQAYFSLKRLYNSLLDTDINLIPIKNGKFKKNFYDAMNDDFNTPLAYSVLFDMAYKINQLKYKNMFYEANVIAAQLRELGGILGLLNNNPENFLKKNNIQKINNNIESLIKQRAYARKNKNWHLADVIRNRLFEVGIILEDKNEKTFWRKK
ncbi:cysteine--tRNA ligase [Candidatus Providencia siddallii]|uniref:Cysteine--tRNA ligase n=1 Tax=Candidatus Providencia siddallii TaxID=1715285 RepID=A0ABM9NPD0_9GAMM